MELSIGRETVTCLFDQRTGMSRTSAGGVTSDVMYYWFLLAKSCNRLYDDLQLTADEYQNIIKKKMRITQFIFCEFIRSNFLMNFPTR